MKRLSHLRRLTMPPRYMAIVAGSLLFLVASDGAVLLRGANATPLTGLGTLLASLAGMLCLVAAAWRHPTDDSSQRNNASAARRGVRWTPARIQWRPARIQWTPARLRWTPAVVRSPSLRAFFRLLILAVSFALALDSIIALVLGVTLLLAPPSRAYPTDAISFAHADAALVLAGANPYTSDAGFPAILRSYPHTLATPLRGSIFGTSYEYPSDARILAVQRRYITDPAQAVGAFDPATLHSYPALSFLLYVPLLAIGLSNILVLHLLVYAGLLVWLVRLAPPGLRRWATLAAGTNAIVLGYSFLGDAQGICLALLLVAWHSRNRRWAGPILLGLACAYRQYCWFFVPFFLLAWAISPRAGAAASAPTPAPVALRGLLTPLSPQGAGSARNAACSEEKGGQGPGVRILLRRLVSPALIALAAFLLPNLPYILAAPGPWFASLWLPMTDPMFPNGVGFDALFTGHLLPYIPPSVFAALESLALVGSLWAAVRWRERLGDGVLLLALVPLLFAYRSLPNYFAVAPWIALYAANRLYAARATANAAPAHTAVPAAPQLLPEATV